MIEADIEHIISSLKKDDVSVLESIYNENRIPFLHFAKKYSLSEEDVIDIYQEAIIAFRDNVVNGKVNDLKCSVRTYLFSIGKFMIFKKIRIYKNDKNLGEEIKYEQVQVNHFDYYEPANDNNQQLVNECFSKLGDKCKQVLQLFYFDGLSLKEIQVYFNYDNYNVVKSQKSRCLRTLKELVNEKLKNG
ncbi:MAG: sigma-70 family RNA polymerase sigma factor [Bacteroidia bacterium]|nr:sigma-70 family RNA polymerase sigma factor [Bacteroidia bacterium]